VSDLIVRLIEGFLRFFVPTGRRRRGTSIPWAPVTSIPCVYADGPTSYRTGERPLRGEDSPLVRPYLVAHEQACRAGVAR
jgi:hypothetical protein